MRQFKFGALLALMVLVFGAASAQAEWQIVYDASFGKNAPIANFEGDFPPIGEFTGGQGLPTHPLNIYMGPRRPGHPEDFTAREDGTHFIEEDGLGTIYLNDPWVVEDVKNFLPPFFFDALTSLGHAFLLPHEGNQFIYSMYGSSRKWIGVGRLWPGTGPDDIRRIPGISMSPDRSNPDGRLVNFDPENNIGMGNFSGNWVRSELCLLRQSGAYWVAFIGLDEVNLFGDLGPATAYVPDPNGTITGFSCIPERFKAVNAQGDPWFVLGVDPGAKCLYFPNAPVRARVAQLP